MSTSVPLLSETIEPDEPTYAPPTGRIASGTNNTARPQVVLTPSQSQPQAQMNSGATASDMESGLAGIFKQSAHPVALFFLYFFRGAAVATYILGGFATDNFVLSTVLVVVLLSMDFWNCRNVAGRTLVGLRFWNQVDDDGESYWVFESRDPSRPANPVDSRFFWTALYAFPAVWILVFVYSLLTFKVSYLPIIGLALVFNFTNVIGFTYADRDAKQKWANSAAGGWAGGFGLGGVGGQIVGGIVKQGVGRMFGA